MKPLIIILGPTASGKSKLALKLAKEINGEIITADSRQIYKETIIATGSPYAETKRSDIKIKNDKIKYKNKLLKIAIINNTPHHLLHFLEPKQKFSVTEYKKLAIKIIYDIHQRGKIPILIGGTGLYISSIVDNIEIPEVKPNLKLRKKLEKTPLKILLKKLSNLDQVSFKTIDKNNKRRIIRAIEVTISSGKPFSSQKQKGQPLFDCLQIGIDLPREKLYKKIDQRIGQMIKSGLAHETKKLIKKYSDKLPSMSSIGYKETSLYLRNKITLNESAELIKFATHAYVRRQMTWFKKDHRIKWIKNYQQAKTLSKKFLKKLEKPD